MSSDEFNIVGEAKLSKTGKAMNISIFASHQVYNIPIAELQKVIAGEYQNCKVRQHKVNEVMSNGSKL